MKSNWTIRERTIDRWRKRVESLRKVQLAESSVFKKNLIENNIQFWTRGIRALESMTDETYERRLIEENDFYNKITEKEEQ